MAKIKVNYRKKSKKIPNTLTTRYKNDILNLVKEINYESDIDLQYKRWSCKNYK